MIASNLRKELAGSVLFDGVSFKVERRDRVALADDGISARVVDLYSLKPIDAETLREAVEATQGRLVVTEDHWPEGGLGEAVLSALAGEELSFAHLAVREMPGSGKPAELLAAAGIDADAIAAAARALVQAEDVAR